ncbi:MAG: XRE family transcriptional regulator [Actinomycetota bacterium]|nr:XRE family transcriptional regulator [Actinomycetota bacterium]
MGGGTASTGVAELDQALGGLYWGDNVVWETDERTPVEPFFRAIAETRSAYDVAVFVTLTREPASVHESYPALDVLDARPGTSLAQPRLLLERIRRACLDSRRTLLLLDSLDAMSAQWGNETARRFFLRGCPLLLELGAVAYWSLVPRMHSKKVRGEIEEVTQCVLAVGEGRVRIAKAEGRAPGVAGRVFRYRIEDRRPVLAPAPAAARLGTALRALRVQRGLSQGDLARLSGVSPSAISQAERGHRGLSLETLLDLTAKLNITLDEFLRGEDAPGYRLARGDARQGRAEGRAIPLLDDPLAGLRAYLVRLSPGGSAAPGFPHKDVEIVAVAQGLVQVILPTGRPVLRQGEALLAERSGVTGWRNLGEGEAIVFWVLRDEPTRRAEGAA